MVAAFEITEDAMEVVEYQLRLRSFRPVARRPETEEDWNEQKTRIAELYSTMNLKALMTGMEQKHGFKAT